MCKAIVFDLDGTLLDTLDDLFSAVNAALSAYKLPLRSREEVRGFVGNGIVKLMQRAVGREDHPDFDGILWAFKRHYKAHCADQTQAYEGILPLLTTLKARGVKTAVVSNKADFAVKLLAKDYFEGLLLEAVGENEEAGIRKKPAPDSLLAVMERLGVTASETLYVGDSEVDIQTAKNAGVRCISVSWGFKDREFLLANGAEILIDTPSAILEFCGD